MNLNADPSIIRMASTLGLDVVQPVTAIQEYCRDKVRRFLRRAGRIENVEELQRIVCRRLRLTVHEIRSAGDIEKFANQYRLEGELAVFAAVKSQLKTDTFGMLLRLQRTAAKGQTRYVAFIDCRGDKIHRRVWTLWHEIAHCLTARNQPTLSTLPTTAESIGKDPIERLTDIIAGDFAFYEPLFLPVFEAEFGKTGRLSFKVVELVRKRFNPEASFDSTLNACVAKAPTPIILLEAGLALKSREQRLVDAGNASLADFSPRLRVLKSVPNAVARTQRLYVPKKMRVPLESVISRIHAAEATPLGGVTGEESLRHWTTSEGARLPDISVIVEARKVGNRVVAIIALAA